MTRTVSQKMNIKENSRAFFVNADKAVLDNINLPTLDIQEKLEEVKQFVTDWFMLGAALFVCDGPWVQTDQELESLVGGLFDDAAAASRIVGVVVGAFDDEGIIVWSRDNLP